MNLWNSQKFVENDLDIHQTANTMFCRDSNSIWIKFWNVFYTHCLSSESKITLVVVVSTITIV